MKSRYRKQDDPADEPGPMSDHDTVPLDTLALRATVSQLAAGELELCQETADLLAIERGEDEGMLVRACYGQLTGGKLKRGHYAYANAKR